MFQGLNKLRSQASTFRIRDNFPSQKYLKKDLRQQDRTLSTLVQTQGQHLLLTHKKDSNLVKFRVSKRLTKLDLIT